MHCIAIPPFESASAEFSLNTKRSSLTYTFKLTRRSWRSPRLGLDEEQAGFIDKHTQNKNVNSSGRDCRHGSRNVSTITDHRRPNGRYAGGCGELHFVRSDFTGSERNSRTSREDHAIHGQFSNAGYPSQTHSPGSLFKAQNGDVHPSRIGRALYAYWTSFQSPVDPLSLDEVCSRLGRPMPD